MKASVKKKTPTKPVSTRKTKLLPQYRVILHNDTINNGDTIVERVMEITRLEQSIAVAKTAEAHTTGHSCLLTTHKERAELYKEQFAACTPIVTVSIEPA